MGFFRNWVDVLDDESLTRIHLFKDEAQLPLILAMLYNREILNEIRKRKYDIFTAKIYVSKKTKIKLL